MKQLYDNNGEINGKYPKLYSYMQICTPHKLPVNWKMYKNKEKKIIYGIPSKNLYQANIPEQNNWNDLPSGWEIKEHTYGFIIPQKMIYYEYNEVYIQLDFPDNVPPLIPNGWYQAIDPKKKRVYYYNNYNISQFEFPIWSYVPKLDQIILSNDANLIIHEKINPPLSEPSEANYVTKQIDVQKYNKPILRELIKARLVNNSSDNRVTMDKMINSIDNKFRISVNSGDGCKIVISNHMEEGIITYHNVRPQVMPTMFLNNLNNIISNNHISDKYDNNSSFIILNNVPTLERLNIGWKDLIIRDFNGTYLDKSNKFDVTETKKKLKKLYYWFAIKIDNQYLFYENNTDPSNPKYLDNKYLPQTIYVHDSDWLMIYDKNGKKFYYNKSTKDSQWKDPKKEFGGILYKSTFNRYFPSPPPPPL